MVLMRRTLAAVCSLLAGLGLHADEATLRDGRRVTGTLAFDGKRWSFTPAVSIDELLHVRLSPGTAPVLHGRLPMRLLLRDGSHLTGDLGEVDGKTIALATSAAGKLSVPRTAVVGLRHPPGWGLLRADDLDKPPADWKIGDAGSQLTLAEPIAEGRLGISFRAEPETRCVIEAEFAGDPKRRATVELARSCTATVDGLNGESTPLPLAPGRHRLVVRFALGSLSVDLDGQIAWHSLKRGPGGPLVRLALRGRSFDSVVLHRVVDEPRRPVGDAEQDEAWLATGDQLFGRFLRADRQGVVMEGKFGRRVLAWPALRGVFPTGVKPMAPPVGSVRLWIDNGFDSQHDVIEWTVHTFDGRRVIVKHADLGEITLERSAVLRLAWPAHDQR